MAEVQAILPRAHGAPPVLVTISLRAAPTFLLGVDQSPGNPTILHRTKAIAHHKLTVATALLVTARSGVSKVTQVTAHRIMQRTMLSTTSSNMLSNSPLSDASLCLSVNPLDSPLISDHFVSTFTSYSSSFFSDRDQISGTVLTPADVQRCLGPLLMAG